MNVSKSTLDKITNEYNDKMRIYKALCLGPVENPIENDYFNADINNIIDLKKQEFSEGNRIELINGRVITPFIYDIVDICSIGLALNNFKIASDQAVFFINNIYCNKEKAVILSLGKYCKMKVWVNSTLIYNGYIQRTDSYMIFYKLKKGNNIIFTECSEHLNTDQSALSKRIFGVDAEFNGIEREFIEDILESQVFNNYAIIQKTFEVDKLCDCELMVIPRDFVNIDLNCNVVLHVLSEYKDELYRKPISFYERVSLSEYTRIDNNKFDLNIIYIEIEFYPLSKYDKVIQTTFFLMDRTKLINELRKDFYKIELLIENYEKLYIESLINWIENEISDVELISIEADYNVEVNCENIKSPKVISMEIDNYNKAISLLSSGNRLKEDYFKYGVYTYFWVSKLDSSIQRMNIFLPKNYTKLKEYPLIVFLTTYHTYHVPSLYRKVYSNQIDDEVIIACIPYRGVTTGSYVGEAAIMECLDIIKSHFSIDICRIYLHGYSNGAYATWAIAQAYPYIFAAICTIDGVPYKENIRNYMYMPVFNIVGEKRHLLNETFFYPDEILSKKKDYIGLLCEEAEHRTPANYCLNSYIIKWFLKYSKDTYPRKFYFRSERMRHNKSDLIEVLEMGDLANYFEVEGEIKPNNEVVLNLYNIKKYSLLIPTGISKIVINGKAFAVDNVQENILYFDIIDDDIEINHSNNNTIVNKWLGIGILDIYLEHFKIVPIIKGLCYKKQNEIISVARIISSPKTQGLEHTIYVNYPIISESDISEQDRLKGNLVIIGCCESIDYINGYTDDSSVIFNQKEIRYMGFEYKGDYCILTISKVDNISHNRNLIIYTNNIELFRGCIFLREFLISSYSNGIHPFLNNEVLIYTGKKYYGIYRNGDTLQEIV